MEFLTKPYAFQDEAVRLMQSKFGGRSLLADDPGLGKSIMTLYYAYKYLPKDPPGPIVIVPPAHLKINWRNEIRKHTGADCFLCYHERVPPDTLPPEDPNSIIVCNYNILVPPRWRSRMALPPDSWAAWLKALKPRMVVGDECFPYDTPVLTEFGWIPIGRIVEEKAQVRVGCWDFSSNAIAFSRPLHYFKIPRRESLVEVTHQFGKLVCTENHEVWTENRGYVKAKELQSNDLLWSVQQRIPVQGIRTEFDATAKILRNFLFSEMENVPSRNTSKSPQCRSESQNRSGSQRKKATRGRCSNAIQQSILDAGSYRKGETDETEKGNSAHLAWEAWGEWTDDGKREICPRLSRNWLDLQSSYQNENEGRFRIPHLLQSGRWPLGVENSRRSRWEGAQLETEKRAGQEKAGIFGISRVESIQSVESRSEEESDRSTARNSFVYCIEVEQHHNFIANGVLVSNCHAIKNPKTQCTRAFRKLVEGVDYVHLLTGTPITNKPGDIWSLINILCPKEFPSEWEFLDTYSYMRSYWWGWRSVGAKNLDLLNSVLESTCMIRRRKQDVLQDLPPVTYSTVQIEADLREYRKAEGDFVGWMEKEFPTKARNVVKAEQLSKLNFLKQMVGQLKVPAVVEFVNDFLESTDGKLLLGAIHHSVTGPLMKALGKRAVLVNGKLSDKQKNEAFDLFNKSKSCRVLVGNLQAAGTGWSCQSTSNVDIMELPWTADQVIQFCGRVEGINRGIPGTGASVRFFTIAESIDDDLAKALQTKQRWASEAIDGDPGAMTLPVHDLVLEAMRRRHGHR